MTNNSHSEYQADKLNAVVRLTTPPRSGLLESEVSALGGSDSLGGGGTPWGQHFAMAMPESPMAEFWMGSDPGIPLDEVCPIPGMSMPKDGYVTPTDAPGFGMEIMPEWVQPWDHAAAGKG